MRKKVFIIVCCVFILIMIGILGYRGYLIYGKYQVSSEYLVQDEEMEIDFSTSCEFSLDYYTVCLPESFTIDSENTVDGAMNVYQDTNGRRISFASIDEDLAQVFEDVDGSFDASELLDDVNIENTVDLLHYLDRYGYQNINYFSSMRDVKLNYVLSVLFENTIPDSDRSYITGDYTGYVLFYDNDYEVNLIHNHRRYVIYFSSNNSPVPFTESDIISIIGSIQFKD